VARSGQPGGGDALAPLPTCPRLTLSREQAAELLQVEAATVIELAQAGELPARCIAGVWRLSRTALLAWLDGHDGDA
jgi:excisionase family DNA binding protein